MAGPAPKTKNWSARENAHEPSGLHVIVTGEVEVSATNVHTQLTEGPPAGNVLPLDLTITESGMGAPAVVWMAANFQRQVSANEFDRVEIRWDGKVIATVPVIDDTEHDALVSKQAQAQNTVVKVKTVKAKKAAPKKAVAKKAAAAKVAKTVAKKAAKKPSKKPPKKATKKAAKKKPAPKSAFKKFVKKMVKKLTPKKAPKKKAKKSKKRR
jgi:hypothetical protein